MNWLLVIYSIVFAIISIGGVYTDIKSKYSWWITGIDILAGCLGLAGLVIYQLNIQSAELQMVWKPAFVTLILSALFVQGVDIYDEWQAEPEERNSLIVIAVLTFLFELPCALVNYLVAYK